MKNQEGKKETQKTEEVEQLDIEEADKELNGTTTTLDLDPSRSEGKKYGYSAVIATGGFLTIAGGIYIQYYSFFFSN